MSRPWLDKNEYPFRSNYFDINGYKLHYIDGFGLSDKPEHYDYSTLNHSKTLEKFILEKELNNIAMVVHDLCAKIIP